MRKKLQIAGGSIAAIMMIVLAVVMLGGEDHIDISSATEITLKYHYNDKKVDVMVRDEKDIKAIKENLKEVSYIDHPSCGFSLDVSITLSNGEESIVLCPACDSCATARIGESSRYISIKDRKALESVLRKYGVSFPCV